jgi:hypothetical protein
VPTIAKERFSISGGVLAVDQIIKSESSKFAQNFVPPATGRTNQPCSKKNHRLSGHDEHAMTGGSVESAEPGERWELFRNLNQRSSPERRSGGYCRALTCRWIWARSAAPHLESRLLTGWNSADPTHGTSKSLDIKRRDPHIQTGKRRPRRPDRKKAFAWYLL